MRVLGEICESRCAVDGFLSNLSVWLCIRLILLLEFWREFFFFLRIKFYAVKDTVSFNIILGLNLTGLMIFAKFQGLICKGFRSKWSFWLTAANFSWYFHRFFCNGSSLANSGTHEYAWAKKGKKRISGNSNILRHIYASSGWEKALHTDNGDSRASFYVGAMGSFILESEPWPREHQKCEAWKIRC